jgi:hypothetical protein
MSGSASFLRRHERRLSGRNCEGELYETIGAFHCQISCSPHVGRGKRAKHFVKSSYRLARSREPKTSGRV